MTPFTGIGTMEADHISEADFKFNFELYGVWMTLRETSRNMLTLKPVFLEPGGQIWT